MKQKLYPITDKDFVEAIEALNKMASILLDLGYDESTLQAIDEGKITIESLNIDNEQTQSLLSSLYTTAYNYLEFSQGEWTPDSH